MNTLVKQPKAMRRPPYSPYAGDHLVRGGHPLWWAEEIARHRAQARNCRQTVRRWDGLWLIQDVR